jgi:hypothetical protein
MRAFLVLFGGGDYDMTVAILRGGKGTRLF